MIGNDEMKRRRRMMMKGRGTRKIWVRIVMTWAIETWRGSSKAHWGRRVMIAWVWRAFETRTRRVWASKIRNFIWVRPDAYLRVKSITIDDLNLNEFLNASIT